MNKTILSWFMAKDLFDYYYISEDWNDGDTARTFLDVQERVLDEIKDYYFVKYEKKDIKDKGEAEANKKLASKIAKRLSEDEMLACTTEDVEEILLLTTLRFYCVIKGHVF
jgi:hypothetical protein